MSVLVAWDFGTVFVVVVEVEEDAGVVDDFLQAVSHGKLILYG